MGGIIFVILPLFFIIYDYKTLSISLIMLLYGLLGLVDDLLIIIKKNNNGINPNIKLLIQIIIAGLAFFIYLNLDYDTVINVLHYQINIKWLYGILMLGILTSSTNAFNITDGIDGLLSGLTIIMGIGFMYIAYKQNEINILYMLICVNIVVFIFWCFNMPKANLFMGDTGSLALGAFYSMVALYLDSIYSFILMALLIIFETISVILQVFYYKKTNGKRLFKMAPFHHHLEAIGYNEIGIDLIFYTIEAILVSIVIFIN
jgi:phospho-N-acetylmuramoyl-pentapeptide-transferase